MDEGKTWTLLAKDDYGTPVSTENLSYAFRRTGKYKVVLTDEFRTGIDAITAEVAYTQKTPEAVLTGVENGEVTHTSVTIAWTDEGVATLTKDGEIVEYKSGQELNEEGTYKFTITNYDGDTTSYTFTIEKKNNGCAVTISIIGVSVFVGLVIFILIKRRKNF